MPTYAYRCPDCDTRWDEMKRISSYDTVELCPKCSQVGVRVFTPGYFTIPGQGANIRAPKGCVEVGDEKEAMNKVKPEPRSVSDREIQEWARSTTEFQALKD